MSIIKSDSFKIKLFLSYSFWTQPLGRRRLIKPSSLFIIFSIIMSFGEFSTCVVIIEVMAWNCYYINIARSLTLCRMVKGSLDWLTEYTRERCFKCSSFKVKYVHTFSYIKHTRQRLNMVLLMLIYSSVVFSKSLSSFAVYAFSLWAKMLGWLFGLTTVSRGHIN